MPRGVALTCPRTYNDNSPHIPLWLPKGGANALHLITNNLPRDMGATPYPSLWCLVSTSSFGDGTTNLASSLGNIAGGNVHIANVIPARHQQSSPTSRHSPYYEGTSSLGSRHQHSSTMTTGATLCLRASTSVGCTFIIPRPAFRCSTGHKWTGYRGAFRYLVHMPTPGWILGAV
jgi:hypothetical protein